MEVTHIVPSPGSGLLATQPGGNAGAVTLSQFSTHGPDGLGLGVPPTVAVAVAVRPGVPLAVGDGTAAPPPRSYASTRPFPVPPLIPASSAVYVPGGNVAAIPDSRLFDNANPAAVRIAACSGSSIQLSLALNNAPLLSRSSSVGSASASGTPKSLKLGPIPRRIMFVASLLPPRMKPAIMMSEPVLTKARVLMLPSLESAA